MGLDVYARAPARGEAEARGAKYQTAPDEAFHRAGCDGLIGWLTGAQGATFRGGSYDELVERVTGQSLYDHEIPLERVRVMAERLQAFVDSIDRLNPIDRLDPFTRELIATGRLDGDEKEDALASVDDDAVIAPRAFGLAEEAGLLHGVEDRYGECTTTVRDARKLACWFRVCADEGFIVDGWW